MSIVVKAFKATEECLAHLEMHGLVSVVTSPDMKECTNGVLHEADCTTYTKLAVWFGNEGAGMTPLFKKLSLTTQDVVHVLNAPASFESELAALQGVAIQRTVSGRSSFAIAFAVTQAQRDAASTTLAQACEGDAVLWIAYPKGTSRKYTCEFNRDSGWSILGAAGFEPVRQVAIDEDWSALRFRRVEHIKTMTRNPDGAISVSGAGKAKAARRGDR